MNNQLSKQRTSAPTLLLLLTVLTGLGSRAAVLPINSTPNDHSYGEWAVKWWQWALGIPASTSPLLDDTGAFAGVGQSGPVWFLGGSFGDSKERTFTIPSGKAIFIPVHQWIFGATVNDCEPSVPGVTCDVATLREAAAQAATCVETMEVKIDKQQVKQLTKYRALSPDGFNVTLPPDNVIGFPPGTYGPHVADGYWLMLTPLSSGRHTIQVHATNPCFGIDYTVIYHITVK